MYGAPEFFRYSRARRRARDVHKTPGGVYDRRAFVVLLTAMNRSTLPAMVILAAACGGASSGGGPSKEPASTAPPASAAPAEPAPPKTAEPAPAADPGTIPDKCADGQADGICAPPRSFVQTLCGAYPKPELALVMFSKKSPFTRVYMNRN